MVAAQPIIDANSPIVLAGIVRIAEFALIALIGVAIYFAYVYPQFGDVRPLLCRHHARRRGARGLAFQVVDIYHLHAFRRPGNQLRQADRRLVARLPVAASP